MPHLDNCAYWTCDGLEDCNCGYRTDTMLQTNATRVEVVGDMGRICSERDLKSVKISFQDGGLTLKVFIDGDRR